MFKKLKAKLSKWKDLAPDKLKDKIKDKVGDLKELAPAELQQLLSDVGGPGSDIGKLIADFVAEAGEMAVVPSSGPAAQAGAVVATQVVASKAVSEEKLELKLRDIKDLLGDRMTKLQQGIQANVESLRQGIEQQIDQKIAEEDAKIQAQLGPLADRVTALEGQVGQVAAKLEKTTKLLKDLEADFDNRITDLEID